METETENTNKCTEYGSVVYARHGTGAMENARWSDAMERDGPVVRSGIACSSGWRGLSSFLNSGEWDV